MCDINSIKIEEYKALMEEHRINRSYIFERTIIILGIAAATLKFSNGVTSIYLVNIVMAGLIILFSFNLWFTVHRLQSDARIIAYIQIFHEKSYKEFSDIWIGWENALREYRIWISVHKKQGDLDSILYKEMTSDAMSNRIMFYPAIWTLHIMLMLLICYGTLEVNRNSNVDDTYGLCIFGISAFLFLVSVIGPSRPALIKPCIERERTIWLQVIKEKSITI